MSEEWEPITLHNQDGSERDTLFISPDLLDTSPGAVISPLDDLDNIAWGSAFGPVKSRAGRNRIGPPLFTRSRHSRKQVRSDQ